MTITAKKSIIICHDMVRRKWKKEEEENVFL
jgi:hypothetical protein